MASSNALFRTLLAALTLFVMSGCATNDFPIGEEVTLSQDTFSFTEPEFQILSQYRIVPGDQLDVLFQIQTWSREKAYRISLGDTVSVRFVNAPELDQEQKILPDGTVALPYIGAVNVYNKTTDELTAELRAAYSTILRDPQIYVTLPEYLTQIRELKKDLHTASRGLSRLVTVRPDGFVTFPMVGDLYVADRTIQQVNAELNDNYSKISNSLHVDLFLEKHAGSQIYVLGEVGKPGAIKISKPTSVAQALAMAGSHSQSARLDHIVVVRRQGKKLVGTRVDLDSALQLGAGSSHFYLMPDDVVYVPSTSLATASAVMRQLADVLLLYRGWGFSFRPSDN
ncbi:polysaccharide export protein [Ferrimonas balearica DSM 9799]|uniref:Polysaccharide export protein n=1 Tax=Ferrimonas balearica (strain DSM 9799 / CCM 4581 / KCTC 23876 / PAT) TaxID=550540 RepID=E1SW38_FERBD|nr:polysaccharide biosynthesis/export family protein [Ferrimonas balearica]ADN74338.1 polysaccharide export protein [Ferrimonas balearica DSM 9799]MBY5981979.1 polysaccharide biosynthesis/export family protein [Ferrimonas balearica]